MSEYDIARINFIVMSGLFWMSSNAYLAYFKVSQTYFPLKAEYEKSIGWY